MYMPLTSAALPGVRYSESTTQLHRLDGAPILQAPDLGSPLSFSRSGTESSLSSDGKGKRSFLGKMLKSKSSTATVSTSESRTSTGSPNTSGSNSFESNVSQSPVVDGPTNDTSSMTEKVDIDSSETTVSPIDGMPPMAAADFVRPTGRKLEPRVEPEGRAIGKPPGRLTGKHSLLFGARKSPPTSIASTIRRNRLDASEKLCGGYTQGDKDCLRVLAQVIAVEPADIDPWYDFLRAYCMGNLNLAHIPPHPPLNTGFAYLPAFYLPFANLQVCMNIDDSLWESWQQEILARGSMTSTFQNVTISTFERESETFRGLSSSNWEQIDRSISIAAHAIFSVEILVILDAAKDWRFMNNPFVREKRIRFFAGTPMMTPMGEIFGVFSISSDTPRMSFTPQDRLKLYGEAMAATRVFLEQKSNKRRQIAHRNTPLLERDSLINGDHEYLSPLKVNAPLSRPSGGLLIKRKIPQNIIVDNIRSYTAEHTPPSSAESNRESSFGVDMFNRTDSESSIPHLHQEELTPPADVFEFSRDSLILPHRAFSDSDLTSLHMMPRNTPDESMNAEDFSHQPNLDVSFQDFMALEDRDLSEEYDDDSDSNIDLPTSPSRPAPAFSDIQTGSASFSVTHLPQDMNGASGKVEAALQSEASLERLSRPDSPSKYEEDHLQPSLRQTKRPRTNRSSISSDSDESSTGSIPDPLPAQSRRKVINAAIASILGVHGGRAEWPLLYVARMSRSGKELHLVAAFGLKQTMTLDYDMHSTILSNKSTIPCSLKGTKLESTGYDSAFIVPICANKSKLDGYILGALRKDNMKEVSDLDVLVKELKLVIAQIGGAKDRFSAPETSTTITSPPETVQQNVETDDARAAALIDQINAPETPTTSHGETSFDSLPTTAAESSFSASKATTVTRPPKSSRIPVAKASRLPVALRQTYTPVQNRQESPTPQSLLPRPVSRCWEERGSSPQPLKTRPGSRLDRSQISSALPRKLTR